MKIAVLTLLAFAPWSSQQLDVMADTDRALAARNTLKAELYNPTPTSVGIWIEIDNTQHPEIGINGWCQMPGWHERCDEVVVSINGKEARMGYEEFKRRVFSP